MPPSRLSSLLNEAARAYILAVRRNQQFDPKALGVEFTRRQIEVRALELQGRLFDRWPAENPGQAGGPSLVPAVCDL